MTEVLEATVAQSSETPEESYINSDGSYKEGWKDALLPEEMRGEKFYDSPFNANVKELLKTAGNQARMLGKKGVVPINEKSSEFEVKEYRRTMGIPDKYIYQKPKDIQALQEQDEVISKAMDEFNKLNMSQQQVDGAMGFFHNFLKNVEVQSEQIVKQAIEDQDSMILTEENTNYETNSHYIDNAVKKFTEGWPDEDILALFPTKDNQSQAWDGKNSKLLMRKFLANVGKSMGEGRPVGEALPGGLYTDVEMKMNELRNSEPYKNHSHPDHQAAISKMSELYKLKPKRKP